MILLIENFSELYKVMEEIGYNPRGELERLRERKEYPPELFPIVRDLVHYSIERRNQALFSDMRCMEELTRNIFRGSKSDK